jgi:hypothetical protein
MHNPPMDLRVRAAIAMALCPRPAIWSLDGVDLEYVPARSILTTLWDQPRWLEAHHLYDQRGSELFEEICQLPEYYLTRTENAILEASAGQNHRIAAPVAVHRRARRRLQQKNRAPAHRADAPARPKHLRAHRREHLRTCSLRATPCGATFPALNFQGLHARYEDGFHRHRQETANVVRLSSAAALATLT